MASSSMRPVSDLREGDLIDAESFSAYLTTDDMVAARYEYWRVAGTEAETPTCTRVDFDGYNSYGLPPDLLVKVAIGGTISDD